MDETDTCILCGLILIETEANTCEHCIRKLTRTKAEAKAKREGQLEAEAGPKKEAKPPKGAG